MIKFLHFLTVIVFVVALLISPNQTHAKWWNPGSWFNGKNMTTEQVVETLNKETNPNEEEPTVPILNNNTDSLNTEIATLRADLDKLYREHNGLVEKYNQRLKDIISLEIRVLSLENKSSNSGNTSVTVLERNKLDDIESTVEDICKWTFGTSLGQISGCPSSNPSGLGSINSRLQTLER